MKQKAFFMLGGPASGKGTQSKRLVDLLNSIGFNSTQVSTGDLIRAYTGSNPKIIESKETGCHLEDEYISWLIDKRLKGIPSKIIFFDGYPRNPSQVDEVKDKYNILGVYELSVPIPVMRERMIKRNRASDDITSRIKDYITLNQPAIELFTNRVIIDGNIDKDCVFQTLKEDVLETLSYLRKF